MYLKEYCISNGICVPHTRGGVSQDNGSAKKIGSNFFVTGGIVGAGNINGTQYQTLRIKTP